MTTSRTYVTQEQIQAEAAELSRYAAAVSATQQARTQAIANDLAQRNHADLLERRMALAQQRQELGKELQETAHQLRALDQTLPAPGDEDAHDQRAGVLAARERRLMRAAQQCDQQLAELDAQLREKVARDAAGLARQAKAEHNRLVRELVAKHQALMRQAEALTAEYNGPIGELRQQLGALSAITPVDLELVAGGLYRE